MDADGLQNVDNFGDLVMSKPVSPERFKRLLDLAEQLKTVRKQIWELGEESG